MFTSVFVEVTISSQANLHVLQTDSIPFLMSYNVDLVKAWFQQDGERPSYSWYCTGLLAGNIQKQNPHKQISSCSWWRF
jgi:hypothetical protein